MAVRPAFGQKLAKTVHVHPYSLQTDVLPVDLEPALRAGLTKRRESSPQRGASPSLVVFWPEQTGKRVARVAPPGDGQIGEERDRLARVHLERLAAYLDARRAEQRYRRPRHFPPHRSDAT